MRCNGPRSNPKRIASFSPRLAGPWEGLPGVVIPFVGNNRYIFRDGRARHSVRAGFGHECGRRAERRALPSFIPIIIVKWYKQQEPNPERVEHQGFIRTIQPFQVCDVPPFLPWVARSSQTKADRCNPFGIGKPSHDASKTTCCYLM